MLFQMYIQFKIRGVVKQCVTASNSLLSILIVIKYNKMFVDKNNMLFILYH